MRRDSGQIFLIVKLRLIMYSLILPCLQVRFRKLSNLANVESYQSLHYYTFKRYYLHSLKPWSIVYLMAEGATILQWHISHGGCLWGMVALDWLLSIHWCLSEGKRINLCTIMVGGPCSAGHYPSTWPWLPWCCERGWYFKSRLYRPNNPIYCKALINRRSLIKHSKTRRKRQVGNTNTISIQCSEI